MIAAAQYRTTTSPARSQSGATLVELMMALVVLAIGLMAVSQIFPAGARSQTKDRLYSNGHYYAQEKLEELMPKSWADPDLAIGRHPAGTAVDSLGPLRTWTRFYVVDQLTAPLDNLRRVTVTVNWRLADQPRQAQAVTYVRR